jgi:hypothetical protein
MTGLQGKYGKRFIIGMATYVILLLISLLLLQSSYLSERETAVSTIAAVLVALLPIIPFLFVMTAVIGQVRQQDELKKRIHLEAVLITALLTGGLTFSYGLLEASGLVPDLPFIIIAPFMIMVWGATNALVSRWYG